MGSNEDEIRTAYGIWATWTGHGCGEKLKWSHTKTHNRDAARLKKMYFICTTACMPCSVLQEKCSLQCNPATHSERILKNTIPPQQISSFRNKVLKHPQRRKQSILILRRMESMLGYTTRHTYPSVGMWLFYILNSSQVTHCNLPELVHLSFALTSWETHTVAQESY